MVPGTRAFRHDRRSVNVNLRPRQAVVAAVRHRNAAPGASRRGIAEKTSTVCRSCAGSKSGPTDRARQGMAGFVVSEGESARRPRRAGRGADRGGRRREPAPRRSSSGRGRQDMVPPAMPARLAASRSLARCPPRTGQDRAAGRWPARVIMRVGLARDDRGGDKCPRRGGGAGRHRRRRWRHSRRPARTVFGAARRRTNPSRNTLGRFPTGW